MKFFTAIRLAYRAFLRKDEYSRYILAEKVSERIYPKFKYAEFGRLYLEDEAFLSQYRRLCGRDANWHSLDRKFALDQLVQSVVYVDGDTAECGAFEGASSWFICRRIAGLEKQHHIFDSFEGLSEPSEQDGAHWVGGDLAAQEGAARRNLQEFGFVHYHKGWIPERFSRVEDRRFCLVHIDVDLYQPTLDSLEFFYERMRPGGLIICDDYDFSTCPGAKKAMDEFFTGMPEKIVRLPTGQAFITKR